MMTSDNVLRIMLNDCDFSIYYNKGENKAYRIELKGPFIIDDINYEGCNTTTEYKYLIDLRKARGRGQKSNG